MSVVDELNAAADLVYADQYADALTRSVGAWLRAEAATQSAMEPLAELLNMTIETIGGPKAYLRFGKRDDGEIAMCASTNEHALAVARVIKRRYEVVR